MITVKKEMFWEQELYHLRNDNMEIWINPNDGMNLCRVYYCGQTVIGSDRNRFIAGVLMVWLFYTQLPTECATDALFTLTENIPHKCPL